jgi:hypothetical protein
MRRVPTWLRQDDNGDCLLTVWVVPGASRTAIVGDHGDTLKVRISAPPEGGKANKALVEFISKKTGARGTLASGATNRRKVLRLANCTLAQVEHALCDHR